MIKKIFIIALLLLLVACDYGKSLFIKENVQSIDVVQRSSIEIRQAIEVEANSARAFLQNGLVISKSKLNLYEADCEVEINTVSESRQIIEPGVFNVVAISEQESPIVLFTRPLHIASLDYAWLYDNTPVDTKRYYLFRLEAQDNHSQSEVRAVICRGAQSEPYNARLPRLGEMQIAVGSYIKFNL